MLSVLNPLRDMNNVNTVLRLLFAFVCGGLIGMERSAKNRPAGLRTHILVCLAACAASMTGLYLYLNLHLPTDISRLGAQIVSGRGFIGAGTIFVTKKPTVKGLTTAAGLWTSGVIGLAIGGGFYEGALAVTVFVLITEVYFYRVTMNLRRPSIFPLVIRYRDKNVIDQLMRSCKDKRIAILQLRVTSRPNGEAAPYEAVVTLRPRREINRELLLSHIEEMPGILSVHDGSASEEVV